MDFHQRRRVLDETSGLASRYWRSSGLDTRKNDCWRQNLGQNAWFPASGVENIQRYAVAPEFRQRPRNLRIFDGPVRLHAYDVKFFEAFDDARLIQCNAFVHLARNAPCCSEIHKYRFMLAAKLGNLLR